MSHITQDDDPFKDDPILQGLRHEAWQVKKTTGKKHAQCLDEIGQRYGYPNWMRFLQAYKEGNIDVDIK